MDTPGTRETTQNAADTLFDSGVDHARRGRYDHAAAAFADAHTHYIHLSNDRQAANCIYNLGTVASRLSRNELARTHYLQALETFTRLGDEREVAGCTYCLGNIASSLGQYELARTHYQQALEACTSLGAEDKAADCNQNLGLLAFELGEFEQSRCYFERALEVFTRLGLHPDAGHCQRLVGMTWQRQAATSDPAERPILLRRALAMMVPAAVFLDGMRFQFPTSTERVAWAGRIDGVTRSLFEIATELDDETLVADLIESAVNAGVHTISRDSGSGHDEMLVPAWALGVFADTLDPEALTRDQAPNPTGNRDNAQVDPGLPGDTENPNEPDTPGSHLGGTGRLIVGARLPMRPPPRLRMPDTHLALDPWTTTGGGHTYPPLQRHPLEIIIA